MKRRGLLAFAAAALIAAAPLSAGAQDAPESPDPVPTEGAGTPAPPEPPSSEAPAPGDTGSSELPAEPDDPEGTGHGAEGAATEEAEVAEAEGDAGSDTAAQAQQAGQGDVEVVDFEFVPETFAVEAGGTVTWFQTGDAPHTITADDGSFDSHPGCSPAGAGQCMQNGDTYERTFGQPGMIPYYCKVHGGPGGQGMSGVIQVEGAGSGGSGSTSSAAGSSSETASSGAAASGSAGAELADTGAEVLALLAGGVALIGAGTAALGLARRPPPISGFRPIPGPRPNAHRPRARDRPAP